MPQNPLAIIGILAALLLPAVSAARRSARKTACLNNLRQINLGVRLYADDFDGRMPNPNGLPGERYFYKELMKSYVGLYAPSGPDDLVFACPVDRANRLVQPLSLMPQSDFNSYLPNQVKPPSL